MMKTITRFKSRIAAALIISAAIYLMIYADVTLRARSAYLNGEKYWSWYKDPELKRNELSKELEGRLSSLDRLMAKGKISREEHERKQNIEKFNFDRRQEESAVKYSYAWYQTAVELFSPPESKWVAMARKKIPVAREAWKEELRKKNIPFEDYMLE